MKESIIEKVVVQHARKVGMIVHKMEGEAGMPDNVLLYKGVALFIEFKATGEVPRKLQLHKHKLLREQGFTVYVCDGIEEGIKIINKVVDITN